MAQLGLQLLAGWLLPLHQGPKDPGVVHVPGMAQLVDEDVAHQRARQEEELVIEADGAPR